MPDRNFTETLLIQYQLPNLPVINPNHFLFKMTWNIYVDRFNLNCNNNLTVLSISWLQTEFFQCLISRACITKSPSWRVTNDIQLLRQEENGEMNQEEHDANVSAYLDELKLRHLNANDSKVVSLVSDISILGYQVGNRTTRP